MQNIIKVYPKFNTGFHKTKNPRCFMHQGFKNGLWWRLCFIRKTGHFDTIPTPIKVRIGITQWPRLPIIF